MADIQAKAEELIPAEVRMISGCMDSQTSADVSNVASFSLPDPAGAAGGACTSALLKVLYADHHKPDDDLSFHEVLSKMREILSAGSFAQIPQLSASRPLDIEHPFDLVPEKCTGTRRAVLIGINYTGQQGELSGCQNDVLNIKEYIMDVHGFAEENIHVLMDDGKHESPTHANILNAYRKLVAESVAGDAAFCHYSGHGGKVRDTSGDEKDGYDETLIPLDYQSSGQITDDELFKTLVGAMRKGVVLTSIMDCCHSGSVLDLPYVFRADGEETEMHVQEGFDFGPLLTLAASFAASQGFGDLPPGMLQKITECCSIM
mmetsp:Transcript_2146/g.3883  ORF Transcript_2146/g.3883 Transcript_2146/m.3883 type:complete len:318 (-) Transcript_2146:223-1176(-)|eukprot:CAMPEP_0198280456 /NCGR_PEP_ID=MMETSP1449-20131203/524_1 /TAXON_ID=420275 /ORGANISM="Attheya septentrionalis, Strain CCMP2084" /LENGTH=317 /DNA_ID=CAMNT_0043975809 /DNA_START=99 /DNA_END=1052 /DNA_ORIENTATION=-